MEQFEELIEKLKPIYANQIDYYYVEKFAISVLKLLIKLGIKEGEIYRFDERKKRLRQIEAYNTGISFCFYDKQIDIPAISMIEYFLKISSLNLRDTMQIISMNSILKIAPPHNYSIWNGGAVYTIIFA